MGGCLWVARLERWALRMGDAKNQNVRRALGKILHVPESTVKRWGRERDF